MSEVKLKFPVPKRSLVSSPNVKLPIPINDVSCNAQEFVKNFFGKFNGFNVIVDDEKEMDLLYNMVSMVIECCELCNCFLLCF